MRFRLHPALFLVAGFLAAACTPKQPLSSGLQVPKAPVKVTAGDDGGPQTIAQQSIPLELQGDLANRFVAADSEGEAIARIHIHSPEQAEFQRPPANIALIVDTSASMEGEAIEQARASALALLEHLHEGDVLSIVTFGSNAEVLVPAQSINAQTEPQIRDAIGTMKAWGTTDLAGGMQAGLKQVQRHAQHDRINRMVLISDGVPNNKDPIEGLAQQAANYGIPITALGLGLEYHETLLGVIAQKSGGGFHFVEEADKVATVLRDEVLSIDRIAARGLTLTLNPGPGVTIMEVPGHSVGYQGRAVVLGLGDMAEGQSKQILVRLAVGEHRDGATVELLDSRLTYADGRTGTGQQQTAFVAAKATLDTEQLTSGSNPEVELVAARAFTAAATLRIMALARAGRLDEALEELDQAQQQAKAVSEKRPDRELARLLDDLVELRATLPSLAPPRPPQVAEARQDPGKRYTPTPPRRRRRPLGKTKAIATPAGGLGQALDGVGGSFAGGAGGGTAAGNLSSATRARSVRSSHARAYETLHGR